MANSTEFFTIRSEDIDGNAHMNNAAYVNYFDRAASALFQDNWFELVGLGVRPFVRRAEYFYDSPMWFGEVAHVEGAFQDEGASGILLNQKMICSEKVVARASLEYGRVRAGAGKPQNHPDCARTFEGWRRNFVERNGLGASVLRKRELGLFVRRADYFYEFPFSIASTGIQGNFEYHKGIRILSGQEMFQDGRMLARANAEYAFVNLETGRPVRPPADLIGKLKV